MDNRYGALINRFNRMLLDDVNRLVQLDLFTAPMLGAGDDLMTAWSLNRAAAGANQSQQAMDQFHANTPFVQGLGVVGDLAWRLNCIGVNADAQRMADLSNRITATSCRLAGQFNNCFRPGRKLLLTANAVNSQLLDEVCALVQFRTKSRRIDDGGFLVRQGGKTIATLHRPLRYVEKATKLLAIYVMISDHTAPEFLCTFDL